MSVNVLCPTPWRPEEVKSSLFFWNLKEKSDGTVLFCFVFSRKHNVLRGKFPAYMDDFDPVLAEREG